jgi:DNA repair exonuclease SbcCD ATPase subunit
MNEIQTSEAEEIIRKLLHRLNKNTEDFSGRNIIWSIKELKFDSLYGYGEGNRIDFDKLENIVGIFGKNRSGKSSLVGALMYVLFNTSDRGPVKNAHIINDSKDYCCGSVRINVGGTDYIIERRTERTLSKKKKEASRLEGKSSTSVNLWKIRIDDLGREVKVASNGIGRDDTDRLIRRLIGTPEDFLLTAFASQGGLNRFIDNKATKRKEVLNRFLELDVFDRLCSFAKEKYSSLNNMGKNYSSDVWSRTILKTQKDMEALQDDIEKVTASITTISEKRDKLNLWITTHENQAAAIEKVTVENLEKQTRDREGEIKSAQNILKENKGALKEKKIRLRTVTRLQKKYDLEMLQSSLASMQSIETSLGELKGTFDLQTAELSTQKKAVEKLEKAPCGTSFPECHFIKDGHLAKGTIQTQKRAVKQLGQEFEKAQKIFKKYAAQNIEKSIKTCKELNSEFELLDANIVSLEESAVQRKREISILRKDLRSTRSKLRRAIKVFEQLESEEFKRKKQMLQKAQGEVTILETKKSEHLMSLGALQQKLEKLLNEQEEGVNLIKKLKLYESIQSAFSKNGIPAMILKSQLPAINREMANVLDNLVDFTVTLESDVSANIMDVYFEDGKSKRVIELGSGMEKTVCSLALRVALGNLSSLPRPEIFILDESFGALDEDNLQKGMELLSLFSGYFKSIFVITHVTPIKEVADEIIEIKSDGIESTICYK